MTIFSRIIVGSIIIFHLAGVIFSTNSIANTLNISREKLPILVGEDDRRTVRQYAEDRQLSVASVDQMFAASGQLNCPWITATANLVVKNNVVVTNAHVLLDRKGRQKGKLSKCKFVTKVNGKKYIVRLSNDYAAGHSKSEPRKLSAQDWMVVRLAKNVPNVTPYPIIYPKNPMAPLNQGTSKKVWDVIVIAARHGDWPKQNGRKLKDIKSIGECKVRDITWPGINLTHKGVRALRSDCDSGPGSSGGAYLLDHFGKQSLVGLITGLALSAKVGRHEYELGKHDAHGVLLSGAFLNAVEEMAAVMGISEIQEALVELGYKLGPVDGQMGEKTRSAIKAFEREVGLPITGKISAGLSKSINLRLDD